MNSSAPPVVLVHGWGGSFESTWQRNGFTALLDDAGLEVIGVDLLGHGEAPKPHDPDAYGDLTARIVEVLPDRPVDAIGFSLGAMTLLRLASQQPHRFRKLVLAGIGRNVVEPDEEGTKKILAALDGVGDTADPSVLVFTQYARSGDNDPVALTALMRRPRQEYTEAELANVTVPTLIIIGDDDFAGPGEPLARACAHMRVSPHGVSFDVPK